jgi:GEVED domain/Secretion system C-terminal sorting domain
MKSILNKISWVIVLLLSVNAVAQTSISTNFTNNNGSSLITFNFQNTNANDVIITEIASATGTSGANTATLWYKPTAINQTTMVVSTANGWTQVAAQPFTGIANTTTNIGQPMLTGLNLIIPAGATYGLALSLTSSLRYSTITAGSYTFSGGGCNLITGTDIGFGGTLTSGINNRGFIGSVSFISGTACTGAPNAGTTASSANPVCPSVPFNLNMANATFTSGLTYQWQSANTATGPWTNITGATSSAYTATQTVDTWYQCIVTCSSSGLIDTSAALQVTTNSFVNCYCTSGATSAADEEILNVTLSTLNNTSSCGVVAPGPGSVVSLYSNFTTSVAAPILAPGVFYPFSVEIGTCNGNYNNWTKAWIDFNQNGLFTDPGEMVYSSTAATNGPHIESGIVAVPTTAVQGITRMRVVNVETTVGTSVNPCGTYTWGETEDYFVQIAAPPTCPQPTAPTLVSTTLNDATIDWTPGGSETQWQIQYGPQGFALGTGTIINVTTHPYTIPNLTPYSFYQAYIRAICTPGDSSYWTPSISWNTYNQGQYITNDNQCPSTGFIDISASPTATNTNLAYLGETGITLPFPLLYQGTLFTTATIGATGGVKLGTTTAALNFVMDAGNGLYPYIQQLYTAYPVGSGGVFYEQIGTSPNSKFVILWKNLPRWNSPIIPDGASFELIIDEATQEIYYVYHDVIMGNPTAWDYGADAEIGVRGAQNINVSMNSQGYLQNNSCVHFYYVDCPNPVALTPVYVFPNEAAFTWTASAAGETSWTVVYGPAGFDPLTSGTTLTVTSATVQLLNLIPLGNYDMYIYSECAGGLQSAGLFYNFQTPPICSNPTAFTSAAGVDSLMSSWSWSPYTSFYPSTGFNLQVVAQDSALYTGTVYALDNNFTDTTLNAAWYPGQALDVYVQAVCGQDTSAYVGPISLIMPISNDHACGAHEIIVGAPGLLYNNTGATVSAEELGIVPPVTGAQTTTGWANANLNHTTWFKFTAPASGNVRIDATGVEYNGQIGVYYGTDCSILPSFTLEGANDNEIDGTSEAPNFTVCGLTPGVEYYVLHDGSGSAGNYTIEISEVSVYAGVAGEVLEICYGESVNLFLGIANYNLGGEWVATSPAVVLQGNTFNSTDYASQTYTFNYVVSDGCAVDQATSTVTVYAAPSAGEDGSITVCLNEPFDLLVGIGGNIDLGGTWYNPSNQALPGSLDTSGTLAGQYNYDYIVTSPVCPSDTSNVMVIVDGSCDYTASLNEVATQWELFPNPAASYITIVNNSGLQMQVLRVLDVNGKIVLSQDNLASIETELSVMNLNPGIYTVRIIIDGQIYNKRFIKQ